MEGSKLLFKKAEFDKNKVKLKLMERGSSSRTITIELTAPWDTLPWNKLDFLTPILIKNLSKISDKEYETTPDSLIIINPDIMIGTRIIQSTQCPRQCYINLVVGEQMPTLASLRGTLIHNCIENYFSRKDKVSIDEILTEEITSTKFVLDVLEVNSLELYEDVKGNIESLTNYLNNLNLSNLIPEYNFIAPTCGINGRMDFWSSDALYELKTGRRIPDFGIWPSDKMQVNTYLYAINETKKHSKKASIIYSSEESPIIRQTELNQYEIQNITFSRNKAYFIHFCDWIPRILPVESKKCRYCFVKTYCEILKLAYYKNDKLRWPELENMLIEQFPHYKKWSDKEKVYFNHFSRLIQLESFDNKTRLANLWKISTSGRVRLGKALGNLKLKSERRSGGSISLEFSCENKSELKPGEPVILSMGDIINDETAIGRITSIGPNRVVVTGINNIQDFSFLDSYPMDTFSRKLNKSLFDILIHKEPIKELIVNGNQPTFNRKFTDEIELGSLDPSQKKAIFSALSADNYALIHGPAGTGKTYTIAYLIQILVENKEKILISAYTNTAVDNIVKKLLNITKNNFSFNLIRLGSPEVVDQEVRPFTFDKQGYSLIKLLNADIIAATTTTIGRSVYDKLKFDYVIIDEASQMTEIATLAAINKGRIFILVGDDKQLPALVKNKKAIKLGYSKSLFERLRQNFPQSCQQLQFQYRMHTDLFGFSNKFFYSANPVTAYNDQIGSQSLSDFNINLEVVDGNILNTSLLTAIKSNYPMSWIINESDFEINRRVSHNEVDIIIDIVKNLLNIGIGLNKNDIGIIAPFRGQVSEIRRKIPEKLPIIIDTIDRFQGSDREIIILSLCTLEKDKNILEDERRLNVALTRAKKKLIICGEKPNENSASIFIELFNFLKTKKGIINDSTNELAKKNIILTGTVVKSVIDIEELITPIKGSSKKCIICNMEVNQEEKVNCPVCSQVYHSNHLEDWLENNNYCAACLSKIILVK